MSYRFWLFITGLAGALAVIAGAYGAHALKGTDALSVAAKVFATAQSYHAIHTLALLGVSGLLAATEERRGAWAVWMLQIAAWGFLGGILLFSGGIYAHIGQGLEGNAKVVPVGGVLFIIGWVALALSSFGFKGKAS